MNKHTKWIADHIPDQRGKVAVITGANSGIGFETAQELAGKGAKVVMACRNLDKAETARDQIRHKFPKGNLAVMALDLGDLDSVHQFVAAFKGTYDQLDLLVNNAGIMYPPYRLTAQGFESQFGTNHLGHFALTGLLFDLITRTSHSRIVNVSSVAHITGQIRFDDLNFKRGYNPIQGYAQSKLANLLFTYELSRKLVAGGHHTLAVAAHPGWTTTKLHNYSRLIFLLSRYFAQKPPKGALPILYAATAPDVVTGEYFGPGGLFQLGGYPKRVRSIHRSYDQNLAQRLWEVSEELTGVSFSL
jgi:NAD(P)-dependent dehydrogenase (short-subunit alcohol dehydrogenase family)